MSEQKQENITTYITNNEEQHLLPSLLQVQEFIPSDDIKKELQYWNHYLNQTKFKYDEFLLLLKNNEYSKLNLTLLYKINKNCNDLYNEIYTFYCNTQNKNIIKYFNDIDK